MVKIYLNRNQLDDDCFHSLGELLKDNEVIELVDLGLNDSISDKGIGILAPYIIGNVKFKYLDVSGCKGITDKSTPLLKEIALSSCLENIIFHGTKIDEANEIKKAISTPVDEREIPLATIGYVKSAAKFE